MHLKQGRCHCPESSLSFLEYMRFVVTSSPHARHGPSPGAYLKTGGCGRDSVEAGVTLEFDGADDFTLSFLSIALAASGRAELVDCN